ncbi:hypothetical protein GN244_ATG10203 [Phytophthora infestans]|uniref:Uncharacterized protein n=1 Tax=Phytophthora infestans TaxID=4787 RepID=A0A833T287_PHYIN|nr:hypothetical protein GN244_ATG10203 [Phytophthora infestans]KAI9983776.1 hypothetical protein PInf_007851 [Phytophthora infestans]
METLNERVLAHVPTQQLHQSYNAVLQEEIASVSAAVSDVVTAFSKLEEVRDAIAKLEQGHDSTGGRRASLIAALANTLMLQRELQHKTNDLGSGLTVNALGNKRKRDENDEQVSEMETRTNDKEERAPQTVTVPSSPNNNGRLERNVTQQVMTNKRESAMDSNVKFSSTFESKIHNENGDEVEGSEAAWKALMRNAAEDKETSSEKQNPVIEKKTPSNQPKIAASKTAGRLKSIMDDMNKLSAKDRAFVIPDMLIALKRSVEEDITGSSRFQVAHALKILVRWRASECEEQSKHLELYRDYAAAVESFVHRLPQSKEQQELKRCLSALVSAVKNLGKFSKPRLDTAMPGRAPALFSKLVGSMSGLPPAQRERRLLEVLVAFKKRAACEVQDTPTQSVLKPLNTVSKWLCENSQRPRQLLIYRMLFDATRRVVNRIPEPTRHLVAELVERMTTSVIEPSGVQTRKYLKEICHRSAKTFAEMKKWRGKPVPDAEINKLFDAVEALVNHVAVGWDPSRDPFVNICVNELRTMPKRMTGEVFLKKALQRRLHKLAIVPVQTPKAGQKRAEKKKKTKNSSGVTK